MSFCIKLPKFVVQKHASNLGIAMVTKGWRRPLNIKLCFENDKVTDAGICSQTLIFGAQGRSPGV